MFEGEGKLELDNAPTEGATGAAVDCLGSLASTQTFSVEKIIDGALIVFLAALSSDGAIGSTVGAGSARTGSGADAGGASSPSVSVEAATGVGVGVAA